MNRNIDDIDFVVFDVETTGLSPILGDRIIEIAALRYRSGKTISSFSSLVNPGRKISQAAFEVNHISQEMVDSAPKTKDVIPKFVDFADSACLVGYNVGFDLGFLENELKLLGKTLPCDAAVIDVMHMARRILKDLDSFRLANVSKHIGIKAPQVHRALGDVELTLGVFVFFLKEIKSRGLFNFMQFYNLFGFNPKITEDINNQHVAAIQRAIDLGVRIKIKYYSSSGSAITEREVDPKEIRQEGKSKYLVGYCHLRGDERTFKINAILNLEII